MARIARTCFSVGAGSARQQTPRTRTQTRTALLETHMLKTQRLRDSETGRLHTFRERRLRQSEVSCRRLTPRGSDNPVPPGATVQHALRRQAMKTRNRTRKAMSTMNTCASHRAGLGQGNEHNKICATPQSTGGATASMSLYALHSLLQVSSNPLSVSWRLPAWRSRADACCEPGTPVAAAPPRRAREAPRATAPARARRAPGGPPRGLLGAAP